MSLCDGSGVVFVAASYPGDYDCVPCAGCEVCAEVSKDDALMEAIKQLLEDAKWTKQTLKRIARELRTGRKG